MKLYATVTSERASKGQGGNEYVEIELMGKNKFIMATMTFIENNDKYHLFLDSVDNNLLNFHQFPTKGKKTKEQKGD